MSRWKVVLGILWFGSFLVMAGMTMIMPFLPLYLQELGIEDEHEVAVWAGAIFASTFITSFLFQPLWAQLADRHGRKIMLLRSGFGMAVIMILMGLSQSAWQLLALRIVNGMVAGFNPAATALISSIAPKERMGFALGTLQSGGVAGSIIGPLIGGIMADLFGFRPIFFITGSLIILASILVLLFVEERFDRRAAAAKPQMSIFQSFAELSKIRQLPALFTVTFILQFAFLSAMPVIPLFIQHISEDASRIALYSGLVGSITGLSNIIASPVLGRLADRIDPHKILWVSLIGAALSFIPQATADSIFQLLAARFLLGLCLGGIVPTVNALISRYTPDGMQSRAFGFNTSSFSLGSMIGPAVGGVMSGWVGLSGVFYLSAILMFVNGIWVYAFTRAMAKPS